MTHSERTPFSVAILAAGKGTRMKDPSKAKVLFPLAGKPLLGHVIETALALSPASVVAIIGYKGEDVELYIHSSFANHPISVCWQHEQRGTGHAVLQTKDLLGNFEGDVVILSGDVPLLRASSLAGLLEAHQASGAACTVLSVQAPDPTGYGRIVRNAEGEFMRIVEHKDASEEEKNISEINSGIYAVNAALLFEALSDVRDDNAQGELYLTDIVGILRSKGHIVSACTAADYDEVQGVNTIEQLQALELHYQQISTDKVS